jgi:hypothetical protein
LQDVNAIASRWLLRFAHRPSLITSCGSWPQKTKASLSHELRCRGAGRIAPTVDMHHE